MNDERYARNEGLFGAEGQEHLGAVVVGLVGYGGLGSILGPELAYLGVIHHRIVEFDEVDRTNLNRLAGALPGDEGLEKTAIASRTINAIQPGCDLRLSKFPFGAGDSLDVLRDIDVLLGSVDGDPVRLDLLEWASAQGIPYIDAATDVVVDDGHVVAYGGRVLVMTGDGCLACLGQLDQEDLRRSNMTGDQREVHDRIYGIGGDSLLETGPAVVTLNGVVASLAATEFMVLVTGLRTPVRLLTYRADDGGVRPDKTRPRSGCAYCARYRPRPD